jgi:hypothetical protein
VAQFITDHFIPARVHVKDQPADFKRFGERFGANWTPTILHIDPDGTERHRIEGFLPAEDFIAQLALGLGHAAFQRHDYDEAERRFREVLARHPDGDAAPEALYWVGVSRYKESHDAAELEATARAFAERFTDSSWAKKASVWAKSAA